jgi:hypothetical protein
VNSASLNEQIRAAAESLESAQEGLEQRVQQAAEAERAYKTAEASLYLANEGRNQKEREAKAEPGLSELRYRAHLAEGLSKAGLEAVRNRRTILSALQTVANLSKEEAAFSRTAPYEVVG